MPAAADTPLAVVGPPAQPTRRRLLPTDPARPLTLLLALYPVWWLLGLGTFIFPLIATPLLFRLLRMGGRLRFPPGFAPWLVFLAALVVSLVFLDVDPVGAMPGSVKGRLLGVTLSLVLYASVTVIALYAYNLEHHVLPQRRLVRLLAGMFVVTVLGGFLGIMWPTFQLTSPMEMVLPPSIAGDQWVQSMIHPAAAQLQEVFDGLTPRPAAPYGYTNTWGQNLAILLPWFAVAGWAAGRGGRRWLALALITAAMVPAVFSLNRGLWIGLAASMLYLLVRSLLEGRVGGLLVTVVAGVAVVVTVLLSPLASVFDQRLDNGDSDRIRVFTTQQTIKIAHQSPLLGYGSTRAARGSAQSIAIGETPACSRCGNPILGSNGQVWANLVGQGLIGVVAYAAFFLYGAWRYRHDRSPIGYAGVLVLLLGALFQFYYNSLVTPLCFYLLSLVVLARNEELRRAAGLHRPAARGELAARRGPRA